MRTRPVRQLLKKLHKAYQSPHNKVPARKNYDWRTAGGGQLKLDLVGHIRSVVNLNPEHTQRTD